MALVTRSQRKACLCSVGFRTLLGKDFPHPKRKKTTNKPDKLKLIVRKLPLHLNYEHSKKRDTNIFEDLAKTGIEGTVNLGHTMVGAKGCRSGKRQRMTG